MDNLLPGPSTESGRNCTRHSVVIISTMTGLLLTHDGVWVRVGDGAAVGGVSHGGAPGVDTSRTRSGRTTRVRVSIPMLMMIHRGRNRKCMDGQVVVVPRNW